MSLVHVFTSTQRFSSLADMQRFVDPTYSSNGDMIPSRFMKEAALTGYEPACIEAIFSPESKSVVQLLTEASYCEQWLYLLDPSLFPLCQRA